MKLSAMTKTNLIIHIQKHYDYEINDELPKLTIIRQFEKAIEDGLEPLKKEPIHEVSLGDMVKSTKVSKEVKTPFRPKWSPSYRHNGEYYATLSSSVIQDWYRGVRDTPDTQTIAFWVDRKGSILVKNTDRQNFEHLK